MQSIARIPLYEPHWDDRERAKVALMLTESQLNEGKYVREFERKFAEFVKAKYAIVVPNGSLALYVALYVWQVRQSHYTYSVPDNYGIFAANALMMVGKEPVISDVGKNGSLEQGANKFYKTIVVHANGRLGEVDRFEDCAQAISHHTKDAISTYSFHSTKPLTLGGIGGAVCCDDADTFQLISAIKDHGRMERCLGKPVTDNHNFLGANLKMADINCAFGLVQLERLAWRLERIKKLYKLYQDLLAEKVEFLPESPSWRVDCLVEEPQLLVNKLAVQEIEVKRYYLPTHRQRMFERENHNLFKNSEHLYQHGLYLPSSPTLTDEQVHYVCDKIKQAIFAQA